MRKSQAFIFTVIGFFATQNLQAQYEVQVRTITQELSKKIAETSKKRIAVADFTNSDGVVTKLGQFISEELNTYLPEAGQGFEIIDRSRINVLIKENQLRDLTDPATSIRLGKLAGIEALIYGTITSFSESVRINIKILDIQRGTILRSLVGNITRTADINRLLDETVTRTDNSELTKDNTTKTLCKGINAAGATLTVRECILGGQTITCELLVTNNRQDKANANFNYSIYQASIITDTRKQYGASSIVIANTGTAGIYVTYNAIYGTEVDGKVVFNVEDSIVKKLQIFEMRDQGLKCLNVPVVSPNK